VTRAHQEIERRREAGAVEDLCAELLWRIRFLGGHVDLHEAQNREAFMEVVDCYAPDTKFAADRFRVVLNPNEACAATLDEGGLIRVSGFLVTGASVTASFQRDLFLDQKVAHHRSFRVVPRYRGNQIAPRSLRRCVGLYDQLGIQRIRLRACYSGSWYWAQWGFHFERRQELERIQEHAQRIVDKFGGGLDVGDFTHPSQFFYLGEGAKITFRQLIDALPQCELAYGRIAYENGLGTHDPIPFGRAVLLTGPSWDACLDLSGPDRFIYDDLMTRTLGEEETA